MITIYHNPRCSKSRQTLQLLNENNASLEVVEYLNNIPSEDELRSILSKLGMNASELVRKSETIYKDQFKGKEMSNDDWIAAMVKYPKLIERPIVINKDKAVIGRPPENVLEIL